MNLAHVFDSFLKSSKQEFCYDLTTIFLENVFVYIQFKASLMFSKNKTNMVNAYDVHYSFNSLQHSSEIVYRLSNPLLKLVYQREKNIKRFAEKNIQKPSQFSAHFLTA